MTQPMTRTDVSRLLGRVAFGATARDLDLWTGREYGDLVDALLDVATLPAQPPLPDEPQRRALATNPEAGEVDARLWWLERMRTTPAPLLERMTLLWHGHFATGVRYPPGVPELMIQNQTLRTYALGNLVDLVAAVNVDPAMLFFLNGFQNCPPRANENYGREFFELFTLGKHPQVYTEHDIREAARAFTGWSVGADFTAVFTPDRHDRRSKRILGKTVGDLGQDEHRKVTEIALAQPVASRFFAFKLVANLAYVPAGADNVMTSKDPLLTKVAATLRSSKWDVKAAVRVLLLADEFRFAKGSHQLVRQPVEAVVHAAKALDVAFDPTLVHYVDKMGQTVFNPLNVGGWPLGRNWVSPVAAVARYDAGLTLHRMASAVTTTAVNPLPDPDDVPGWARRLGHHGFGPNTTAAVKAYLRRVPNASAADRQAGTLALLLSSPEWVVL
jgi:uncharacterized protein (DUF1800 family)